MTIAIGQEAPDFELAGANVDGMLRLSSLRGETAVALVFYTGTFTGICEGELCAIRDDLGSFAAKGVQVVAVSCDPAPAQKVWAEQQGYTFPVLGDFWPHGEVARAYGVFNEAIGRPNRATFLIDRGGTVVDAFETADVKTARDQARYEEALAKLG